MVNEFAVAEDIIGKKVCVVVSIPKKVTKNKISI
jgi:hypothetical protein